MIAADELCRFLGSMLECCLQGMSYLWSSRVVAVVPERGNPREPGHWTGCRDRAVDHGPKDRRICRIIAELAALLLGTGASRVPPPLLHEMAMLAAGRLEQPLVVGITLQPTAVR